MRSKQMFDYMDGGMAKNTQDTKQRILVTATEMFGNSGFKATTVREICKLAGTNVSAINYYFGDKEGLYRAVLEDIMSTGYDKYPPDTGLTSDASPEKRLYAFIRSFLKLGVDITVSVIPGQPQSASIAQQVSQLGAEVILHLPMEPLSASYKDDGYIILADMNQDAVIGVLNRGLEDVPGIVGVNNHMGSRVTSNRRTMTWIMQELHTRGLYFLDSRTFARSVAYQVAREMGLPTGKRDVFLDTDRSREAIKKQVWELVKKSRQNSFAIGIGHCHQETLDVLREEIPKIQEKGYRFVTLSKVIR